MNRTIEGRRGEKLRLYREHPGGDSPDPNGIRQFVVGTGDRSTHDLGEDPNTEVQAATFGALKMTLKETGYSWEFVSTDGSFSDTGEEECHN